MLGAVSASDLLRKIEFAGGGDLPRFLESRRHRQHRRKATATVDLLAQVDGGAASMLAAEVDHGAVLVRGPVDRRSVTDSLTARLEAVDGVVRRPDQSWRAVIR